MKKIIDISSNTTILNADSIKNYDGVYIKATEGGTWTTPNLDALVNICRYAKVPFGFYHFAGKEHTALQEYTFFKQVISQYHDRLLPDCLDYELPIEDTAFIQQFLSCDSNLIFYSYQSLINRIDISNNRKWVAILGDSTLHNYLGVQYLQNVNVVGLNDIDVSNFDDSILNKNSTISNIKESVASMGVIKMGENSSRVRLIQSILNVLIGGVAIDGVFGTGTKTAVIKYQQIMHLSTDGIVGNETIDTLLSDLKNNWFKI